MRCNATCIFTRLNLKEKWNECKGICINYTNKIFNKFCFLKNTLGNDENKDNTTSDISVAYILEA